jgi:predicted dithiol-disulfide oxidoreductase (DUF899 family)
LARCHEAPIAEHCDVPISSDRPILAVGELSWGERIEAVKARMGWAFRWVSSGCNDFSYDFGVSFRPEDREAGPALYNYGLTTIQRSSDMFGLSVFAKDKRGDIFHTYSTYYRGTELLMGAFHWLEMTPKGRNETDGTMSWLKLHDEY